jgi:Flp pilus assembly pilin Flp
MSGLVRLVRCRRGVTSIEYAIIAAIMAVMLVAVLDVLGPSVSGRWNSVATSVTEAQK